MASDKKVIFVMGATGTGKSRLAIGLAKKFQGEIINSDKIQVYKGLDILTNKVTESECQGVPHHLIGTVNDPDADFTTVDFRHQVNAAIKMIHARGRVPVVAGGSNTYIQALVEDPATNFTRLYACRFIWVDVALPVLFRFVGKRVNQMVEAGAVEEVREMYAPGVDATRGIYRAIGFPEIGRFLETEVTLREAAEETKENTCRLVVSQVEKIRRLREARGWDIRRVDSTAVFEHYGEECCGAYWEEHVWRPSLEIVGDFLNCRHHPRECHEDNKVVETCMGYGNPIMGVV